MPGGTTQGSPKRNGVIATPGWRAATRPPPRSPPCGPPSSRGSRPARIADALTHSYYCKTERPTDAWAVGDPAVCFWLSGTNSTGAPGALTTLTISSHGSWAGTSTWGPTETPSIFVEGGPGPEMPGPLVLRNGWVGPPPTRMAPWPNDWPRLAADK